MAWFVAVAPELPSEWASALLVLRLRLLAHTEYPPKTPRRGRPAMVGHALL